MLKKILIIIFLTLFFFSCAAKESPADIKRSAIAGRWYTSDASELSKQIDALLGAAPVGKGCDNPLMLIVPHAGYQYSGRTAASGYRMIGTSGKGYINPDLIIILGPSHYKAFRGCSTILVDYFETPLGKVKLNKKIAGNLLSDSLFKNDPSAFSQEHSIEIHLPFLQRIFGDKMSGEIRILPILVGELDDNEAGRIAGKIASAIAGTRPFIIVSSDFTHYGPDFGYVPFKNAGKATANKIKELDSGAVGYILKKDISGFSDYVEKTGITICGRNPIKLALSMPVTGFKALSIFYDSSGNITGDYTNSVSYTSILCCGTLAIAKDSSIDPGDLTPDDKKFLVKTARENIASWLANGRGIKMPKDIPMNCMLKRGAFVTLKIRGDLRGCIGYILAEKPLIETVLENSYNAAFEDPRFMPLQPKELKDISIEISVLTEPELVRSADEIKTGRDGLIAEKGTSGRGLLLPQVATEQGWDKDTFLSQTCLKAGLPAGSWKDSATRIYRFQAIVFSEEDFK